MSNDTLCKLCNKKVQVCQQFDVDIVPPASNVIKNETPTQVFSCGFFEFFQSATLFKAMLLHRCFPVNLANAFYESLFAENLRRVAFNDDFP